MLWPTESANQVQFQWTTGNVGPRKAVSTTTCRLVYDETNHYIRIVDAETTHVLDTLDGYDVLGANISIDLNNDSNKAASDPRVQTTGASAPANAAPTMDAMPNDTQAHATLTIYVHPRKPPTASSVVASIYRTCRSALYFKTDDSVCLSPTPTYERPATFASYGARYAHHRTMTVLPVEDLFHVRELIKAIRGIARTHHPNRNLATMTPTTTSAIIPPSSNDGGKEDLPKEQLHYVIICNPTSGPNKNAEQIAHDHVIPMLQQAHIETTMCVTTHPGHAVELCHLQSEKEPNPEPIRTQRPALQRLQSDIAYYNGIVVMGGDGTMHEVIQGIRSRPDAPQILATIPIGIIGCGTANGLATSLSHTSYSYFKDTTAASSGSGSGPSEFSYKGIMDDIFSIAKGYTIEADLSTYSILESTDTTNDQATSNDPPPHSAIKEYTSFLTFTYGLIAEVDIESERIHWMGPLRFDVWAAVRVLFLRKYPIKLSYTTETAPTSSHNATLSVSDPVPSSWTTIEDKITLFWASQVSHAGSSVYNSPPSKTADGMITIMLIRGKVSQVQLLRILLGLESGTHVAMSGVEWIRCTAFRLEPMVGKNIRRTFNNIDGEKVEYGPIQGVVLPKAIKYFIAPP